VAELMAPILGWDAVRIADELASYDELARTELTSLAGVPASERLGARD
jgi:hypothetical protein